MDIQSEIVLFKITNKSWLLITLGSLRQKIFMCFSGSLLKKSVVNQVSSLSMLAWRNNLKNRTTFWKKMTKQILRLRTWLFPADFCFIEVFTSYLSDTWAQHVVSILVRVKNFKNEAVFDWENRTIVSGIFDFRT